MAFLPPPPVGNKVDGASFRDWFYKIQQFLLNVGSVTSVNVSGGTTGLTTSGGPVTTAGTITLAGTLDVDNGGTGLTTLGTANQVLAVNAGATALEYQTVSGGGGSVPKNVLTANLTIDADTSYIVMNYLTLGSFDITITGNLGIL